MCRHTQKSRLVQQKIWVLSNNCDGDMWPQIFCFECVPCLWLTYVVPGDKWRFSLFLDSVALVALIWWRRLQPNGRDWVLTEPSWDKGSVWAKCGKHRGMVTLVTSAPRQQTSEPAVERFRRWPPSTKQWVSYTEQRWQGPGWGEQPVEWWTGGDCCHPELHFPWALVLCCQCRMWGFKRGKAKEARTEVESDVRAHQDWSENGRENEQEVKVEDRWNVCSLIRGINLALKVSWNKWLDD